jgi:topoisomerase IV subunit A
MTRKRTATKSPEPNGGGGGGIVRDTPLAEALSERYLTYALSTIMARSLPDARDGLKPVQRRLLYAMRLLKLDPSQGFKKCARVVGDVIGKFHPHGEQAVYDALVRLAQFFAQRYPLVDGQGNFGNVDGDGAAAMRYTEARLTPAAEMLLTGIDEDAVDFRSTYDGEESEPLVLPAAFPNLLANGASGIAVGMATSIPPHNALELCQALLHLIKSPKATDAKLMELIPGPDFPTGGVLIEPPENIAAAYKSGRGSFRLRALWVKEELERGQWQIVVTEIPYQVAKGRLIERIAELINERKLPLLSDVRDESAVDVRLILEPKSRAVEPEMLMESLFRSTELETRVPLNLNVLDKGRVPKVMSLKEALRAFLDHRHEVLERRSKFRLAAIERRLELLAGFLIVYGKLDAVIAIIREEDEPKAVLMKRFKLSETQADAILDMRLRSLRKLEEESIKEENDRLTAEAKDLAKLLKDEDKRWAAIAEEIEALKKRLESDKTLAHRRTSISKAPVVADVPIEAVVAKEPITVICSQKGWIRTQRGHVAADAEATYKEGDAGRFWLHAETTDKLILFGTDGRAYTLSCDKLPGGRGHGEPVRLMVELANDKEIVVLAVHKPGTKLVVAASDGRGLVVAADEIVGDRRAGKQILNLSEGAVAAACAPAAGDSVAVIGTNRKLLVFPLAELPEMARGRGVRLQRYHDGALSDVQVFAKREGMSWVDTGGRRHVEADLKNWTGKRGQAGRVAPRGFNRNNKFTA